jgi:hypothetical protein
MLNDPLYGSAKVAPVYDSTHKDGDISLNLPIGTTNSPTEVIKILDRPPLGESTTSPMGRQRYYNKADLIVITTMAGVALKSGNWNSYSAIAPDAGPLYSFIKSTLSFTDQRENKSTLTTEIDVGALNKWLTNVTGGASVNNLAKFQNGHQLNSIYVDDQRVDPSKLTVVRVVNGKQLPPDGLTVATDLPLYVQGHYNAPDTTPGSTITINTKPASLVGDSVTVLSGSWKDTNSTQAIGSRAAIDTTVNAAFLAGIVQTTNIGGIKHYSGGLENFPRFLEDWGGRTFTYNGSMVVMFPSRFAKSFWPGTGSIYNPPTRRWAFDNNFLVQSKLPPCTPQVRKLLRGQWNAIAANAH